MNNQHDKVVDISFDGFLSSKLLKAAAQWESDEVISIQNDITMQINSVQSRDFTSDELVDYCVSTIKTVRPSYHKNDILNILICISQGFLTVFSGEPGSGKTSICRILADVLGTNDFASNIPNKVADADLYNRFVPVSVERGWTSKRDFIGYYNPLSKTFDKSNKRVFESLQGLDSEAKKGFNNYPFIILLDEANLSPMEHYWSDFMNICDDLGSQSIVNLGEDYSFRIPETLRFIATINNDNTTEQLSPRLINRAWIITLPYSSNGIITDAHLDKSKLKTINWNSLQKTFNCRLQDFVFTSDINAIYESVLAQLKKMSILVSSRVNIAIKRYWAIASALFEEDETKTEPTVVALDYAIAQRILPNINGAGEDYEIQLEELRKICSINGLNLSAKRLMDIIDKGKTSLKYFSFFS